MASTRTDYLRGVTTQKLGNDLVCAQNKIDLSVSNSVASDVIQALSVPKGAFVLHVGVVVNTAEGGTLTATVGDGTDANDWDASVNLDAASGTATGPTSGTDANVLQGGKLYTAADTIDLTMSANAGDTAVFTVFAIYAVIESIANS